MKMVAKQVQFSGFSYMSDELPIVVAEPARMVTFEKFLKKIAFGIPCDSSKKNTLPYQMRLCAPFSAISIFCPKLTPLTGIRCGIVCSQAAEERDLALISGLRNDFAGAKSKDTEVRTMIPTETISTEAMSAGYAFFVQESASTPKEEWVRNGMIFATETEAKQYGCDLLSRWFGICGGEVRPVDLQPTYRWVDGRAERLPQGPEGPQQDSCPADPADSATSQDSATVGPQASDTVGPVVAVAEAEMFKWPWTRSDRSRTTGSQSTPPPPSGPGWVSKNDTRDGIDVSRLISDLVAWGFEVHRRDNVQDVVHLASGRGVQASGCDLDTMLWFIHRAVAMGRDSVGFDLDAAQRGR